MKKFILFFIMFVAIFRVFANDDNDQESRDRTGVVISKTSTTNNPLRVPPRTDIVLIVQDNSVVVRFNGDFGLGSYQLSDLTTGNVFCNSVYAFDGETEVIDMTNFSTVCLDFYIEFEDHSSCHLVWNESDCG